MSAGIVVLIVLLFVAFVGMLVQLVRSLLPLLVGYRKADLDEQGRRLTLTIGRFLWAIGWYAAVATLGLIIKILAMVLP